MRKTKTSAAVKNRYNAKAYDRIAVVVPKGDKEKIREYAASKGESVNGFINRLIHEEMRACKPPKTPPKADGE